ncbi:MAG TPA: hypothetical protein VGG18_10165 [Granulicella sp.]|jgi:hypothetical protein
MGYCVAVFVVANAVSSAQEVPQDLQAIAIAASVPLHVRVTHTAKLRIGSNVSGVLTEPVYVRDRLVLPKDSPVSGIVTAYTRIDHIVREQALLNGDVTPLHDPVVHFTSLQLSPGNSVTLDSIALIRNAQLVRFVAAPKRPSLYRQGKAMVKQRIQETREAIFGPDKKDRALRLLYSQLPYHPQRIWSGTQFIANLTAPATVMLPVEPPIPLAETPSLNGIIVSARLARALDSKDARKGDAVTAIVTQPVFDADHKLVLGEGSELEGSVYQSKSARSFGRNGALRFAFRGVKSNGLEQKKVFGTLTGAEGAANANVSVDSEGNVKANPDANRFVAPLLLALTAVASHDDDSATGTSVGRSTVASNGLGLIARVVAVSASNANVAAGFGAYAFAKSIYFRFLTRGHEVSFPKDTQVEVQLATRN